MSPDGKRTSRKNYKKKFRFLLDSAFAKPQAFKRLCKKANTAHTRHTYNLSAQAEDEQIYTLATAEKRIIVTQDADFKKWFKKKGAGVFMLPSYLTTSEIDSLLSNFILGKDPKDYLGKITKL